LNLQGHGWVMEGASRIEFGPDSAGFFLSDSMPLKAQRGPGERHQFLRVEDSLEFLERHLSVHAGDLPPSIQRFFGGISPIGAPPSACPLTHRHRDLLNSLLHPPVLSSAQKLWYQSKALEFAAEFLFAARDCEPLCTRAQKLAADRVGKAKAILLQNL